MVRGFTFGQSSALYMYVLQVDGSTPLTLVLTDNQLSSLPESFGQLTALQTLVLAENQLSSLPESFGQLTALQYLDYLSSLPESFGQLTALRLLELRGNQLNSQPR